MIFIHTGRDVKRSTISATSRPYLKMYFPLPQTYDRLPVRGATGTTTSGHEARTDDGLVVLSRRRPPWSVICVFYQESQTLE